MITHGTTKSTNPSKAVAWFVEHPETLKASKASHGQIGVRKMKSKCLFIHPPKRFEGTPLLPPSAISFQNIHKSAPKDKDQTQGAKKTSPSQAFRCLRTFNLLKTRNTVPQKRRND